MERQQLLGLRERAGRHLDLVAFVLEQTDERRKNGTCGEFVMSIQTRTARRLYKPAMSSA